MTSPEPEAVKCPYCGHSMTMLARRLPRGAPFGRPATRTRHEGITLLDSLGAARRSPTVASGLAIFWYIVPPRGRTGRRPTKETGMTKRLLVVTGAFALAHVGLSAKAAQADFYKGKTTLVVSSSAGGGCMTLARAISLSAQAYSRQSVGRRSQHALAPAASWRPTLQCRAEGRTDHRGTGTTRPSSRCSAPRRPITIPKKFNWLGSPLSTRRAFSSSGNTVPVNTVDARASARSPCPRRARTHAELLCAPPFPGPARN